MRAALVAALLLLAAWPAPAFAHAELINATPTLQGTVARPPAEVDLLFSEQVSDPAYVVVTGPSGDRVETGDLRIQGEHVLRPMRGDGRGQYRVAYRVVSVDGHPIVGEYTFTVGEQSPSTAPKVEKARPPYLLGAVGIGVWALGFALYRRRTR